MVDQVALKLGLFPGQPLGDASAICPTLIWLEDAPVVDAAALSALAAACTSLTPLVAPDRPDGLWLDVTGCLEAEADLATRLHAYLTQEGLPSRIAVATTPGAAWALAHVQAQTGLTILTEGEETKALRSLPLTCLRLEPFLIRQFSRLGLRRIGDLMRIPRGEITVRFGALPLLRLDQALGRQEESIGWPCPPIDYTEELAPVEALLTVEGLTHALALLTTRLCARLAIQNQGCQRLIVRFFRVDGTSTQVVTTTSQPCRDAGWLTRLLVSQLSNVDPGYGVEKLRMAAEALTKLAATQAHLQDIQVEDHGRLTLPAALDLLSNQIGTKKIWRWAPRDSHVPERSVQVASPLVDACWEAIPPQSRPIRLLPRPEAIEATALLPDDPPFQFLWRGLRHRVCHASGPERIAAEWRHHHPASSDCPDHTRIRDYYQVEDESGCRFWLFRYGHYDATRAPGWFLHGIFG